MKKLLRQTHWFWYKTIQRNKEIHNRSKRRLYGRIFLEYECIKIHFILIAVDLNRQKELDADPEAIQKTDFVGQLKHLDGINADNTKPMLAVTQCWKKSKKQG